MKTLLACVLKGAALIALLVMSAPPSAAQVAMRDTRTAFTIPAGRSFVLAQAVIMIPSEYPSLVVGEINLECRTGGEPIRPNMMTRSRYIYGQSVTWRIFADIHHLATTADCSLIVTSPAVCVVQPPRITIIPAA